MQYLGKNKVSSAAPRRSVIIHDLNLPLSPQHILTFPISRGQLVNLAAFVFYPDEEGTHFNGPWATGVDPSYVQGLFHGWEKEVDELVQVSA